MARNNITMLSHPTVKNNIRTAIADAAKLAQTSKYKVGRAYVMNRKGNNFLRIDVDLNAPRGSRLRAWGDCSKNVTDLVTEALLGN